MSIKSMSDLVIYGYSDKAIDAVYEDLREAVAKRGVTMNIVEMSRESD